MNLTELGAFVRSRRDRVQPSDVGLVAGPRRRVPGLRRDEVAMLAGASTDYYIEIERGDAQPSEQMLAALARALRLTSDECDHLFHLAGRRLPPSGGSSAHPRPAMFDLLGRLAAVPAFVCTDLNVTLVQNRLADALFGPIVPAAGPGASFAHRWFTGDPTARALYPEDDHEHHSRGLVADLRAAAGRRSRGDQEVAQLIGDLKRRSAEFVRLWSERDVAVRRTDRKRIRHPSLGMLHVNCLSLLSEDGRQRLLWFTPVSGTDSAEKLELLAVLGNQDLRSEV
ncbi:transcriptional regulator with XRE-family HTH domain [Streptomyces sp. SAI-135]|uniref:MmyB family transcriptional regulator n=1 Tax=unclassified Streptomyces TaxID=2593676 RepID=UPI002475E2A0|nr:MULTISPECIES: helix-turn-helix domain-containing protein [unclassified Streptomyces]MDH6522900.1 transcriptional regulator with XRE-family HTH domain [Streptomyces sp. SAI-090]MDH6554521.1 transcriptional regulator with XRE-family HTH domain [Streptomyces sp. SAI-041]MDH6573787.1 transcriptional regulator with XRE-family HTH domain [Streptomyces sp. SAI-117]MDH6581482.1 transcriptional regulator with XRE-family HTH domain [Streptomyces sp. SAI-133]MDH6613486.1 transcriptional regulator with